ncbi:MAG TPA: PilZ domain-containing protein [Sphingomonadales bacterium]|nr:PilZ domain-containing protein [Sphingomonadales bacterium]
MSNQDDRRRAPRIPSKVPLKVIPTEGGGQYAQSAESINLSERGLYFEMPGGVKPGSTVDIAFTMPPEVTGGMAMKVRCTARVIRVDAKTGSDGKVGVAAHIERFETVVGEG